MSEEFDIEELIEDKFRDPTLEKKVLGYLIRKNHVPVSSLFPEVFTVEMYQTIFSVIKDKCTHKIPISILRKNLNKRLSEEQQEICEAYLKKIYKTKISDVNKKNIQLLIDELKEYYESRMILNNVGKIVNNVGNFDLQKTKNLLRDSLLVNTAYDKYSSGDYLEDYESRVSLIREMQNNPNLLGIKTGIKEFDKLSGGIQNGELGILLAQTGKGKSIGLGNFGMNAFLANKNVALFSLEMTKEQLQFRLDARIARLQHSLFRRAKLGKKDFKKWDRRIKKLRSMQDNFYEVVCVPRGTSTKQIQEQAEKVQSIRGKKIDLILIDYLNLMGSNKNKGGVGWENQVEIAYELKGLCLEFNGTGVPIWTPNQVTDDYEVGKPMKTKHAKYARGIAEVAQIIVGLTQSLDQLIEDGCMTLEVIKCRDFPPSNEPIKIYPDFDMMILDQEKSETEDLI